MVDRTCYPEKSVLCLKKGKNLHAVILQQVFSMILKLIMKSDEQMRYKRKSFLYVEYLEEQPRHKAALTHLFGLVMSYKPQMVPAFLLMERRPPLTIVTDALLQHKRVMPRELA